MQVFSVPHEETTKSRIIQVVSSPKKQDFANIFAVS